MDTCDVCGNEYDRLFTVETHDGHRYRFDSIECAVKVVAPRCAHCDCRILGHGIDADAVTFCCSHCAREYGIRGARDNIREAV